MEEQIAAISQTWSLARTVINLQAFKGVGLVIAATLVAEVGIFSRFDSPRKLMAYLGLVRGEHSSGGSVRPRGITKTGNAAVHALLFEAAWSYRVQAKVGNWMHKRCPDIPQAIKDIAWKAQVRLSSRYRKLVGSGKKSNVAITAVARELVGFLWDVACRSEVEPALPAAESCSIINDREWSGRRERRRNPLERIWTGSSFVRIQIEAAFRRIATIG
ncbi:hypothetical protein ACVINY_003303 [Sinorhizobium meliloti]